MAEHKLPKETTKVTINLYEEDYRLLGVIALFQRRAVADLIRGVLEAYLATKEVTVVVKDKGQNEEPPVYRQRGVGRRKSRTPEDRVY